MLPASYNCFFEEVRDYDTGLKGLKYRGELCLPIIYVSLEEYEVNNGQIITVGTDRNWDFFISTFKLKDEDIEEIFRLKVTCLNIISPDPYTGLIIARADHGKVEILKNNKYTPSIKSYEFEGATAFYPSGYRRV